MCWPSSSHPFQEVTEAQFCAWTPASHASYFRPKFPQFAAAVRQLLLACNAQHKRPGSRRSSAGGGGGEENLGGCKSRRSSSTGGSESGVGEARCCGQLWKKPGGCNGLAPVVTGIGLPNFTKHVPIVRAQVNFTHPNRLADTRLSPCSCSGEGTAGTPGASAVEPQGQASLGLLPYDLVLKIISYLAPPLHFVLPVGKEAVEMLPPSVEHSAQPPVVFMAARLLGPRAPKQPTADAAAWVAAATIVQRAGGGPPGMQLLPEALPAWPLANGVAGARAAQLLAGAAQQAQHAVIAQAVAAAAEPEAPLPAGTHEVLQYTEALALAHLAFKRVTHMASQQEAQAPVLWQYIKAAREAAGKRGTQDRLAALQQHSTAAMTSQEWQRRLAPWPLEDSMFNPVGAP